MSDIQFDEEVAPGFTRSTNERKPFLFNLLFKVGLVKEPKQTYYWLIGLSILSIIASIYFITSIPEKDSATVVRKGYIAPNLVNNQQ